MGVDADGRAEGQPTRRSRWARHAEGGERLAQDAQIAANIGSDIGSDIGFNLASLTARPRAWSVRSQRLLAQLEPHSTPSFCSSRQITLPPELFFGNPQLPADPDNHFIPLSLQQPTTIFSYALSTSQCIEECQAIRKLVDSGSIEGCCAAERYLLDGNDNHIKVAVDVEEGGTPMHVMCKIYFATQFDAIRSIRDAYSYLLSLSICSSQDMHGGKSGRRWWRAVTEKVPNSS